jgi:hypothetical protein
MYLFEFDETQPLTTKIVTVVDQLKNELDAGHIKKDWHIKKLIKYFQKYDVNLDTSDLYNMVKKPPLKKVISNIEGNRVIFKGHESPKEIDKKDSDKTVKQMAKKALKK